VERPTDGAVNPAVKDLRDYVTGSAAAASLRSEWNRCYARLVKNAEGNRSRIGY
jgi:hypothetical protein